MDDKTNEAAPDVEAHDELFAGVGTSSQSPDEEPEPTVPLDTNPAASPTVEQTAETIPSTPSAASPSDPSGDPIIPVIAIRHQPIRALAVRYIGAGKAYPKPFSNAIFAESNYPATATVMTPEGPVLAAFGDYLVSEHGTGIVRVVPSKLFEATWEPDDGEAG